ncbi:AAA family ATPase [Agromyces ramosus]|uniref:MinD-like ATPase involved in chromosome partitioning or flagellar assembly n=1 Tax=Agromyces ramosus TaxID=33879 RepID=A0ABU0RBK3_9MICO|nr:AAA family ATPase [Agromyces ramosus]MDQ0894596.1 MinD-like ATPase involved in chromosome partitioning or flagellar assembly [Agromyces ramosus]
MTPFLLVSRSAEYETRLRALLGERLAVIPGEFLTFGSESVVSRVTAEPRIALLGPVLNYEETKGLVEELTAQHPGLGLIVVREQRSDLEDWVDELVLHAVLSPDASDDTTLALLDRLADWLIANGRAGARDFDPPLALEIDDMPFVDLLDAAAGALAQNDFDSIADADRTAEPETAAPESSGPIWAFPPLESGTPTEAIAVVAPKGGQGKTTIAINLATGLAEVAPNSVVLIDADLQFGDITAALALVPERTIVDAVAEAANDEIVLKTTLTHHADGFFVVASAPSPELGDLVSPVALARLIDRLRATFRYVIVDTTPGMGEHALVALEHVTDAVFVSNMGVPSLRAMRTEFELLTTLGLMPGNRHVVVNQTDKLSGITIKDVENILGAPVDVDVPKSSAVLLASNRGVPLIHDDVRDPAARAIRSIVLRIAPGADPKRSKIQRRRRSNEPE